MTLIPEVVPGDFVNILEELFYFTLFLLFADIKVSTISVGIPFKLRHFTVLYGNKSCYLADSMLVQSALSWNWLSSFDSYRHTPQDVVIMSLVLALG